MACAEPARGVARGELQERIERDLRPPALVVLMDEAVIGAELGIAVAGGHDAALLRIDGAESGMKLQVRQRTPIGVDRRERRRRPALLHQPDGGEVDLDMLIVDRLWIIGHEGRTGARRPRRQDQAGGNGQRACPAA